MCLSVPRICILRAEHLHSQRFANLGPRLCACADTDGADADSMVTFRAGQGKSITWRIGVQGGSQPIPSSAHREQQICGWSFHPKGRGACHACPE